MFVDIGMAFANIIIAVKTYILIARLNHPRRTGFTLPEVVISLTLTCLLLAAAYEGSKAAWQGSMFTAQHVSAFGLCRDRYEQMRGGDFTVIVSSNFPVATVQITELGGFNRLPLTGSISNIITSLANPARKSVQIFVTWTYRNHTMTESISGCIADRNSKCSVLGTVSGTIVLNGSTTNNPTLFSMILPDGTVYGLANLANHNFSYSGPITHLTYKPNNSGTQSSLLYNYQPYPMANAKRWDLDSTDALNCDNFSYDAASKKWTIDLTGFDTVISCQ